APHSGRQVDQSFPRRLCADRRRCTLRRLARPDSPRYAQGALHAHTQTDLAARRESARDGAAAVIYTTLGSVQGVPSLAIGASTAAARISGLLPLIARG